jgi:23S rRNA-/tRNA-specific pseudouridylate synthase
MSVVHSGGDFAHTRFQVLGRRSNKVQIQAQPFTGRMHQIRVHLQSAGFPIYGDVVYGGSKTDWPALPVKFPKRVLLHAASLTFPDPDSQTPLRADAPLPDDMFQFWNAD